VEAPLETIWPIFVIGLHFMDLESWLRLFCTICCQLHRNSSSTAAIIAAHIQICLWEESACAYNKCAATVVESAASPALWITPASFL
jgi:hypothetical protein